MKEKADILLLDLIQKNGSLKKLKHYGLTYRQIADLIEANISNGNLNGNDDVITLTEQGRNYLLNNIKTIKEQDKAKWIELDTKNKIKQIDKEEVFLPSRKELSFLK